MALKTIPLNKTETIELYRKAKIQFLKSNNKKLTDENLLVELLKNYLGE
jgi:hypothetical protein